MDFSYTASEEALRREVRQWLDEHLVGEYSTLGVELHQGWQARLRWERELGDGRWLGLGWPRRFGGRDLTVLEELVFYEEYSRSKAPPRIGHFGDQLLGPTLMARGSEEQQQRFLPPILRGETIWCQGFSEPDAGSDLANVATTARLDGEFWVLQGQKVWTSRAQYADWIFVLCRTESDAVLRHKALSFLLVPMDQPGVEVRPLRDAAGGSHFCEVFFDGARTDADLIVGERGDGWSVAMATLGFERGPGFLPRQSQFADAYHQLLEWRRAAGATNDAIQRQRLASAYIDFTVLRLIGYRLVSLVAAGEQPGALGPMSKLYWSHSHQRFGELAVDLLEGDGLLRWPDGVAHESLHTFLTSRAETIYAGSSEVLRNVIGERFLGLPK